MLLQKKQKGGNYKCILFLLHDNTCTSFKIQYFSGGICMCLIKVIRSFHLFKETTCTSKLQIMKYFSEKHTLRQFEAGSYGSAYFKIFHVILNLDLLSKSLERFQSKVPHIIPPQSDEAYASGRSSKPRLASLNKHNEVQITSCRHADKFFQRKAKFKILIKFL